LSEPSPKPLESGRWAGCIDSVGSTMLSRIITQMAYGGTIAAIGNASGIGLETNILPFLLRGVNLLGIDSVMQPYENRMRCWNNAGEWMQLDTLDSMIRETRLEEMMELGSSILEGKVKGRVVVNPSL
jgi:acrylyl-CoA reductase (NADPH)